ncbi:unnamed protein product [Ixodes persulcatus]
MDRVCLPDGRRCHQSVLPCLDADRTVFNVFDSVATSGQKTMWNRSRPPMSARSFRGRWRRSSGLSPLPFTFSHLLFRPGMETMLRGYTRHTGNFRKWTKHFARDLPHTSNTTHRRQCLTVRDDYAISSPLPHPDPSAFFEQFVRRNARLRESRVQTVSINKKQNVRWYEHADWCPLAVERAPP